MRSRQLDALLQSQQRVLTILWAALLGSVALYVLVAYLVTPGMVPAADDPDMLVIVMSVAAVSAAAVSMVLPRKLLPDETLRRHVREAKPPAGTGAELSARERRLASARGLYMLPWLVGVVLAESVALFGLVLAFMIADPAITIPFAVVGAALIVLKRPNVVAFIERADKLST